MLELVLLQNSYLFRASRSIISECGCMKQSLRYAVTSNVVSSLVLLHTEASVCIIIGAAFRLGCVLDSIVTVMISSQCHMLEIIAGFGD